MTHYFKPNKRQISGHKKKLNNWFKKTDYQIPDDFVWYYKDDIGLFVWSENKRAGFIFRGSKIIKDKLLFISIQDGAEKLELID